MNGLSRNRMRGAMLIAVMAATIGIAGPLIGRAQDATPSAGVSKAESQQLIQRGERIYNTVCIACHQPDGKGIEGIYLPLAGNPSLTQDDPTYFVTVLLNGRGGMPTFAGTYDDEEIAAIASYVRQNWENEAPAVAPEVVAEIRASIDQPDASPTPEGQVPSGTGRPGEVATPEGGTPVPDGSPEASPET